LREERRLTVLANRVQRSIFGPKRDEVTGDWEKLYNEEVDDLYSSPNFVWVMKSRRIKRAGACSVYEGEWRCRQVFGGGT
jgi:hypothetical protein